jgi:hypothetical protein
MSTTASFGLVSLGSFLSGYGSGAKRYDVYNLGKAGAVQIGNVLLKFNDPIEEDIVECLRNAGMPPSAYPSIDIFDPRFHSPNIIAIGNFSIFVRKRLTEMSKSISDVEVSFTIEENTIF